MLIYLRKDPDKYIQARSFLTFLFFFLGFVIKLLGFLNLVIVA